MRALVPAVSALAMLFLSGCSLLDPDDPVEIRVQNASTLTIQEGVLYSDWDSVVFQTLEPGQQTPYKEVRRAYRIATTQVVTASDTARLQVIDFVGETPLEGGKYTYLLSFFEGNPTSLTLEMIKDR